MVASAREFSKIRLHWLMAFCNHLGATRARQNSVRATAELNVESLLLLWQIALYAGNALPQYRRHCMREREREREREIVDFW